jgi:hypothetical protein
MKKYQQINDRFCDEKSKSQLNKDIHITQLTAI